VVTSVRRIVLGFMSTVTVVVLLFGYHTSTSSRRDGESSVAAPIGGAAAAPSAAAPSTAAPSTGGPSTAAPGAGTASAATVTGDPADTRWGPVRVQVTVQSRKITAVTVVDYPANNRRDQQINARALPVLVKETLSAQSARIDMVSGATVTSDGYIRSLQSALDQAGF
jgi:uncharacterized protein with FMN-binding domain